MAKTTAPLLSFGANGAIAKTQVYSQWRGVKYARRYVIPANPRTAAQQLTRTTFALLREAWKRAPALAQAPWNAFATGKPFLGFNKYVGENLRILRGQADMSLFEASPGARGGLPAADMVAAATATAGQVRFTFTVPTLPDGWTLNSVVGTIMPNQDPSGILSGPYLADSAVAPANVVDVDGAMSGDEYIASGFIVYNKPDGSLAYSPSQTDLVTPA